jgi:hypothetical protein
MVTAHHIALYVGMKIVTVVIMVACAYFACLIGLSHLDSHLVYYPWWSVAAVAVFAGYAYLMSRFASRKLKELRAI